MIRVKMNPKFTTNKLFEPNNYSYQYKIAIKELYIRKKEHLSETSSSTINLRSYNKVNNTKL